MTAVEEISNGSQILAILIKNSFKKDGVHFFTPTPLEQQVGYMRYQAGHSIPPHIHQKVTRTIQRTTEVLFLKKGQIQANFFRSDQTYHSSRTLEAGDVLVLVSGCHGFEIVEDAEIYEVKQGPYIPDLDKERFQTSED